MARMGGNENDCSGNARPAVRVLVVEPCAPQGIEAWARAGFIAWPPALSSIVPEMGLRAAKDPQHSIRPRARWQYS